MSLASSTNSTAAAASGPATAPVTVGVITGGHSFDVPAFHRLFRSLVGVDAYIQSVDDFAAAPQETRQAYDVVLLFQMLMDTPVDDGLPWYCGRPHSAFLELGQQPQGIVVLHHALLTYPAWPLFDAIVGLNHRWAHAHFDQTVHTEVVADHPITQGISTWEMVDETYVMPEASDSPRPQRPRAPWLQSSQIARPATRCCYATTTQTAWPMWHGFASSRRAACFAGKPGTMTRLGHIRVSAKCCAAVSFGLPVGCRQGEVRTCRLRV